MKKLFYILTIIIIAAFGAAGYVSSSNAEASKHETAKTQEGGIDAPVYYPLNPFMVNIHSAKGVKMLRATINLELSNPALLAKAKEKNASLRDSIILVLTSKYAEELFSPVGKLICKDDIINRANQILGDNAVKDVYFTDFLMQ
jgi:flagellar FliL protein